MDKYKDVNILIKALEYYANSGMYKVIKPGERNEFGCGCCAGTMREDEMSDFDSNVIGLTAREALAKFNGS